MSFKIKPLFIVAAISLMGFSWPFSWLFSSHQNTTPKTSLISTHESTSNAHWVDKQMQILEPQTHLNEKALRLSLIAYKNARNENLDNKQVLTVIDFSKPSYEKRLWVLDLKNDKILMNTWVSHGKNSGYVNANSFSNQPGSEKSSLGVFMTAEIYSGKHGETLRIRGLEKGFNDNAYRRDIVIHGASYVGPDMIGQYGQVGRSWGCPAVSEYTIKPLIQTIKDKTLIVAYYPDKTWLSHSKFLST